MLFRALALTLSCYFSAINLAHSAELSYRLLIPKDALAKLDPAFVQSGEATELENTQEIGTVLIILAGAAAVAIVADAIADLAWNLTKTGLVIDARSRPVDIKEHPSLSPRQIILVTDRGSEVITVSKREDVAEIMEKFQ